MNEKKKRHRPVHSAKVEEVREEHVMKLLAPPKSLVPVVQEKPIKRASRINTPMESHHFFMSQFAILISALLFLGGMYWVLNHDNYEVRVSDTYSPVTIKMASSGLEIANPIDELLTFSQSLNISGTTTPKASVIIASAAAVDHFETTEADNSGYFQKTVTLAPGLNRIEISTFDGANNTKTVTRTVYYSEEVLQ